MNHPFPAKSYPISRRSVLRAAGTLAAAAALAGCRANSIPASSLPAEELAGGKVYYLNFKPEADAVWQELADTYTTKTGVPVQVKTASGGTYRTTLAAALQSDAPPTLFQCGNQADLALHINECLDLTDTEVCKQLTTDDFNLHDAEGRVRAIGYCYEAFGIIVNKALLAQAGYAVGNITNFATLKTIAEDITARHAAGELPFMAFAPAGLEETSSWRFSGHLANMPLYYQFRDDGVSTRQPSSIRSAYLGNFKQVWDLYTGNCDTPVDQLADCTVVDCREVFGRGNAVFYHNGSWEYDILTNEYGMDPAALQMIPLYCGVNGEEKAGLCCGTENCWAVNRQSTPADIRATLRFLHWVVTDPDATLLLAQKLGHMPFQGAQTSPNVFFADANARLAAGCYTVSWAFKLTPNTETWRADVVQVLTAYTIGTGDWAAVEAAFVDGWAQQYKNQQSL